MKSKDQLCDYQKMLEDDRLKNRALQLNQSEHGQHQKIDLYSHFCRLELLYKYNRDHCFSLKPFYVIGDGWRFDKLPVVIQGLSKVRFFNRFDSDALHQILIRTEMKIIKAREILFLEENRGAILVNGQLFMLDHSEVVATPQVISVFSKDLNI